MPVAAIDIPVSSDAGDEEEPVPNFEGPEKVLEVWFVPPIEYEDEGESKSTESDSPGTSQRRYLLSVPREEWEKMLELVHCQILRYVASLLLLHHAAATSPIQKCLVNGRTID